MHQIGIVGGRLTPPRGRGIQFFPFEEWESEFAVAKKLGLSHIDFIFDLEGWKKNPLASVAGRKKIKKLLAETGLRIHHIHTDFFMRRPFFRVSEKIKTENEKMLRKILGWAQEIGAHTVMIPILDNSSIKTEGEEKIFVAAIASAIPLLQKLNMSITVETDMEPKRLASFLKKFKSDKIGLEYDTGNSAALGFNPTREFVATGRYISNIHIKDRLRGGGTVALGTGDTDFETVFAALKKIKYTGDFTLQVARGEEGKELETVAKQKEFVSRYIDKYLKEV